MGRTVCHFSCGAASAVATKLILGECDPKGVLIVNAFIAEEHSDNRRFLADCERWFKHPITVLLDSKWGSSAREVWRRERFMNSRYGASCSGRLKHEPLDSISIPSDTHVLGFTIEEKDRAKRFINTGSRCPLIERGLTKADCLSIVERAGIELPAMYRLGYNNANCIGCCKGGMGYWNKIRRDFPDHFAEVAKIEAEIGEGAYIFFDRATGRRYPLTQLDPKAGRHDEPVPDCSLFCLMAEEELT